MDNYYEQKNIDFFEECRDLDFPHGLITLDIFYSVTTTPK